MEGNALLRRLGVAGGVVFVIFMFLSFSILADIRVEPNGVISHGTTLTVRIYLPAKEKTVEFEIVADENGNGRGDEGESRLLEKTVIKDGDKTGTLRDYAPARGEIELRLRVGSDVKPGKYVVRYRPGPGRLPYGAAVEITERISDPDSWFKRYAVVFLEMIKEPPYVLHLVKSGGTGEKMMKRGNLWLMNGTTHEILGRLTDTGDCMNPCWSPDGKRVVYIRWIDECGRPWVLTMEKEGDVAKTVKVPLDVPGSVSSPVWSHEGKHIAFLSGDEVVIAPFPGGEWRNSRIIALVPGAMKILGWSRDDQSLIVSAEPVDDMSFLVPGKGVLPMGDEGIKPEDGVPDIWKVDVKTGKLERMPYDVSWLWMRYMSPDGSMSVFPVKIAELQYQLWLLKGKGFNDAKPLTSGDVLDIDPSWSSDGKWIVFVSNRKSEESVER